MRKIDLLLDFYELTMSQGYYDDNKKDQYGCFEYFFREIPDRGAYALFVGLEQVISFIKNFQISESDITYLKSLNKFSDDFLNYLKTFSFHIDLYSMKEGTVIFPNEPLLIVVGPIIECQLLETFILLTLNHQSLIATKTARIVRAAKGIPVMEFGARRAHGYDAANFGARAAFIAGVVGTSNTYAAKEFQILALGTMAHSYIQSYDTELAAFKAFVKSYPDDSVLLIDTYDTLKSGIINAIKVNDGILKPMGKSLKGVRIDSGDLAYLSIQVRRILDEAGLTDTKIFVSNSLDEYLITTLLEQGAQIDSFGVGERLITSKSDPVFGGVYKLVAFGNKDNLTPKIKISSNIQKMTTPGFKNVYRLIDNNTKMAIADLITLHDEKIDVNEKYHLFHPLYPWKEKFITNFSVKPLLTEIFINGKLVYNLPTISEIKKHFESDIKTIWEEVQRLDNGQEYFVDLSQKLWDLKQKLIKEHQTSD